MSNEFLNAEELADRLKIKADTVIGWARRMPEVIAALDAAHSKHPVVQIEVGG
jgi:hypothetical protein